MKRPMTPSVTRDRTKTPSIVRRTQAAESAASPSFGSAGFHTVPPPAFPPPCPMCKSASPAEVGSGGRQRRRNCRLRRSQGRGRSTARLALWLLWGEGGPSKAAGQKIRQISGTRSHPWGGVRAPCVADVVRGPQQPVSSRVGAGWGSQRRCLLSSRAWG